MAQRNRFAGLGVLLATARSNGHADVHRGCLGEIAMHVSNESLLVILLVGVVAGWLASHLVDGTGFGLIGDMVIGVIGAFIGDWLMPQLGIHLGTGTIGAIINATIGAIPLLLIMRLFGRSGRWGSGWGGRW